MAHTGLTAQWDDNDDNGFKVMIHAGLLLVDAMVAFGQCECAALQRKAELNRAHEGLIYLFEIQTFIFSVS